MALPLTRVTILGREVTVKRVTVKELEAVTKEKDCAGFTDGDTIYLLRSLSEEKSKRVLLHEIAHVVLSISGLTNMLDGDEEEAICDALESLLVLFQNKATCKYFSEY